MTTSITATVTGSTTPAIAEGQNVVNGDFFILRNRIVPSLVTGDGSDEETAWTFYLNEDPNFSSFSAARPLTSALLTLTLTPRNEGITTDVVWIETLNWIVTPSIRGLPVDVTSTIGIDLLETYSSAAIFAILFSGWSGRIQMGYGEDAIVSAATLVLTQESE